MGINVSDEAIRQTIALFNKALAEFDAELLRVLTRLGEECVKMAKDRSFEESWIDHTGNLRNSIGYIILKEGKEVFRGGFGAGQGGEQGKSFAQSLEANLATAQYALIIVAGMHYAVYVEAKENKDVLASVELHAKKRLPAMLAYLGRKLTRVEKPKKPKK